jgi:hypothetical protein
MKRASFFTVILLFAFLTACQSTAKVSDTVDGIVLSASGALAEVRDRGANAVQPILETAQEIQKRAQNVESGILLINEGKRKIQEGLSH